TGDQLAQRRSVESTVAGRMNRSYGVQPVTFEANEGQAEPAIKFLSRTGRYGLYLTPVQAVFALPEKPGQANDVDEIDGSPSSAKSEVLRLEFLGANSLASMSGAGKLAARTNYFIGGDPKRWRPNIANFTRVKCESIYPGIDLIYYGNQHELEYDFVVAPGANPADIRLRFSGARSITVNSERDLVVKAAPGEIRQRKPVVYQERDGARTEIRADYVVNAGGVVSFELAE